MVVVVVSKQKQLYDASRTSFRARIIHRCGGVSVSFSKRVKLNELNVVTYYKLLLHTALHHLRRDRIP